MPTNLRHRLAVGYIVAVILSMLHGDCLFADPPSTAAVVEPDEALARLKAGNDRFVTRAESEPKPTAKRRAETAQAQHPFAVVVACADSRAAPEIVFDQNLGELFVVRTAGNLIDEHGLGSIEYAVNSLGVRLIVVLGHERCGAVKAALASPTAPGHVNTLVRDIRPAVEAAGGLPGDPTENAVKANARLVAEKISKEAEVDTTHATIRVISAYQDLDTGEVHWNNKAPAE